MTEELTYPSDSNITEVIFGVTSKMNELIWEVTFVFSDQKPKFFVFDMPHKPKAIFDHFEGLGWQLTTADVTQNRILTKPNND